jgi:hypothetical protein
MVGAHRTTRELDTAIASARAVASSAGRHLGERANEIFGAVSGLLADEIRSRVDDIVLGQAKHTETLADKRLERLRKDVADLLRTLPAATTRQLAAGFQWTFPNEPDWIGDADHGPMYHGAAEPPTFVVDAIRMAVGAAGRILVEAGYELLPASHWGVRPGEAVDRYIGPVEPSPRLVIALRGYADARLHYFQKLRGVRRLEAERTALERRVDAEVESEDALRSTRRRWAETATRATSG